MNAQSQNNPSNRPIVCLSSGVIAGGVLIMIGMLIDRHRAVPDFAP